MPKNDRTSVFHNLCIGAVKQLSSPDRIFAAAAVAQLKAKGVDDADKHRETIQRAFAQAIPDLDNVPDSVTIKVGDPKIDEVLDHICVDDAA